jgi:hypothetical protein
MGPTPKGAGPSEDLRQLSRTLHLAAGRCAGNVGWKFFDRVQGHARIFYTVVVLLVGFAPDGQIQRLLQVGDPIYASEFHH